MTRVLVVHHDLDLAGQEADSLRRFGYDVIECSGPNWNRCPVLEGRPCDLAERADVLVAISGDLGSNGHVEEIIELVAPRYDAERHGPACNARRSAQQTIVGFANAEGMSSKEKDALAERLAGVVGVDYAEIKRKRLLHLMNAEEVREIAAAGVDIQLHTHRHRSPPDEARYRAEISTNRERIVALSGATPRHFCYPSGAWMPRFSNWLGEEGLLSATTCEPGIANARHDRFRLPRLLDHSGMTPVEFDAWLSGLGALLPRRPIGSHSVDADGMPLVSQFVQA